MEVILYQLKVKMSSQSLLKEKLIFQSTQHQKILILPKLSYLKMKDISILLKLVQKLTFQFQLFLKKMQQYSIIKLFQQMSHKKLQQSYQSMEMTSFQLQTKLLSQLHLKELNIYQFVVHLHIWMYINQFALKKMLTHSR